MNKKQKILKAKTIQKDIDFWFKSIRQSIDISTLSKSNQWILDTIPKHITLIDKQLAEARRLGVDELLNLQGIYENIVKYRQIYDEAIKEES
jgi:hypothetical protein